MHGVDGDSLRGVHGGGVAEFGGGLHVGGWQPYPVPVVEVLNVKIAVVGNGLHGPAVTVFDPVGRGHPQRAAGAAGDDQLTDAGLVPIGQRYLVSGGCGESVVAGFPVEFGDEFAGWGEHDRIEAFRAVVLPGGEHLVGAGVQVADVASLVVQVEAYGLGFAVAEGEGVGGFGGAKSMQPVARHWAVEVKRVAGLDAVEQLTRYVELLNRDPLLAPVGGILTAQTIKPTSPHAG